MEPTQEQIREFWEWCDWTQDKAGWWYEPKVEHKIVNRYWANYSNQPRLNLNNLFKYTVPKVIKIIKQQQECDEELAYAILFKKWLQKGYDALALFWAIREIIKGQAEKGGIIDDNRKGD